MSGSPEDRHKLELWLAERNALVYDTGDDWITVEELKERVPLGERSWDGSVGGGSKEIVQDSSGTYFVEVVEHLPRQSTSPLALVEDDVRAVLLNQRKMRLVEQMRQDLYMKALENNEVGLVD